jgi:hypothetical protein
VGQTLSFTAQATDPDIPGQTLTFSLGAGAPLGASMGANGLFSWTPSQGQAPSTNVIPVRVDDNGTPPLNTTGSFNVYVVLPPQISVGLVGGQLSLTFPTISGKHYQVYFKDDLGAATWSTLGSAVQANSSTMTLNYNISAIPHRFYRVLVVD